MAREEPRNIKVVFGPVTSAAMPGDGRPLSMQDVTVTEPSVVKRAVGAAMIGNITEW